MHTEGWAENCRRVKGHEHSIAAHPKCFLLFMMTFAAFFDCLESMYDANLIFLSSWRTFSPKWVSLLCAPVIRSSLDTVRMLSTGCKMASNWQRVLGGVRTVFSRFSGSKAAEVSAYSIKKPIPFVNA